MSTRKSASTYRHRGVALLRAAAVPLHQLPAQWPDLSDTQTCREWLLKMSTHTELADAIGHASPGLAAQLLTDTGTMESKQVRRVTLSAIRYLLRITGRHTPFGLFAGVAPVAVGGPAVESRWGSEHQAFARVDAVWLADLIDRLEACPELLRQLDVVFTNLATTRGERLEVLQGPNTVTARNTRALQAVQNAASTPIHVTDLIDKLAVEFPAVEHDTISALLTTLVGQGFLTTNLRAPLTVTDSLGYLVDRLRTADAGAIPSVAAILVELERVQEDLRSHNQPGTDQAAQRDLREALAGRMRTLSTAGRVPLSLDLRLDAEIRLPEQLAHEVDRAASVLARLSKQPTGNPAWRDFYIAFCERFGTGALVPLADVVDPDAGLGLPHTYPGSVLQPPSEGSSEREQKLLALAWTAWADGTGEIVLTEDTVTALTVGDPATQRRIPAHVELAVRVHAASADALRRGDYTFTVAPARSAGTFTSRFATIASDCGLEHLYADAPAGVSGALPVQLSFPPIYATGENVCRVPAYLPHLLSLGEHRAQHPEQRVIAPGDLAIIATRDGLHLVSLSKGRLIEPQVFHALALDKQAPPLARFLANLTRALGATWHEFDWGSHAQQLPVLPRVRHGRAVLSSARWRLDATDLPASLDDEQWTTRFGQWRRRWRCPATVELCDADRSLRLTLDEPAHVAILHAHLRKHGHAMLLEAAPAEAFGWAGGHVHEIAVPLFSTQPQTPSPPVASRPVLTNGGHGQPPGAANTTWLYAKVFTHPDRINEIIANRIPHLLQAIGSGTRWWFVRYRSPHETDHIRLRLATSDRDAYARSLAALGDWGQQLRVDGVAGRLAVDTYLPEIGRYGCGAKMTAAENVFAADSAAVVAQLRHDSILGAGNAVGLLLGLVDIVAGFFGDQTAAMTWLRTRPALPGTSPADRAVLSDAIRLVQGDVGDRPGWTGQVAETWARRAAALAAYRTQLSADTDTEAVLESLLHMHHNRAVGIDRDAEKATRRMARHLAQAIHALQPETSR